MCSIKKEHLN